MDISKLSLSSQNRYAITNILQSLENAKTYCSYIEKSELDVELEEMIEKFIKRVERKIDMNF